MPARKIPARSGKAKSRTSKKGVLVVGGIIIDLIARSDKFKLSDGNICFPFDSKITLKELREDIGGSAHNAAANLAKLGTKTYILGAVGKGDYGEEALKNLRVHGVNIKYAVLKEGTTGISMVFLVNGEKTILTNRGANEFLGQKDLNPEIFDKIGTMVLTSLNSHENIKLLKKCVGEAKKRGISIVMNPSMSMVVNRPGELRRTMKNSRVIIMNGKESCVITGKKDAESAIKALKKYGAETVIITQDAKGSLVAENGEIFKVPSFRVKVVDTTGGGDSFTAGFIHAKGRGCETRKAVRFASAVAALNIATPGASTDLPSEKEVLAFMRRAKHNA
ncbi:MAG: carbohydrate kinase family protein [Candidatus Aenigmatarchaeota archaeon]